MGRIEELLYQPAWKVARKYAKMWDFKTAVSAGIMALDKMSADERESLLKALKPSNSPQKRKTTKK